MITITGHLEAAASYEARAEKLEAQAKRRASLGQLAYAKHLRQMAYSDKARAKNCRLAAEKMHISDSEVL